MFTNHIYLIYMYKQDLALNNLQWMICYKTKSNQTATPTTCLRSSSLVQDLIDTLSLRTIKQPSLHFRHNVKFSQILDVLFAK